MTGVKMESIDYLNHLLQLASDMHNHRNLWCNHGWSPIGLRKFLGPIKNLTVKIGPGLKQAFREGAINEDEYKATLRKAGFKILGEDVPEEDVDDCIDAE